MAINDIAKNEIFDGISIAFVFGFINLLSGKLSPETLMSKK